MDKNTQFKKNFIWNIVGTGFNAFNSLFFLIIATRVNGINQAGIFSIAFSTACILYAVGLYAGRIYQVTELSEKISDKDFIVNRAFSSFIMIVLVLMFCILKKYDVEKSIVFLLLTFYKSLDSFSDVLYGILQKNEKLEIVGKSLFFKSFFSIILFCVVDIITKNMIIAICSIICTCIIILLLYDLKKVLSYINYSEKIKIKNAFGIYKQGFFTFSISFLGMYVINSPKYAIDTYLQDNFQTIFGIIVMPATIVSLIANFLINPYINQILDLYKNRKEKEFNKLLLKIVLGIFVFGIIATIFGYLIGTQILGIIYGIDLHSYKFALAIIIFSATLYTIGTIFSSVLTTVRETFSQFIIYLLVSIVAMILSSILTYKFEIKGAVFAYFLIMALQSTLYLIYTKIKLKKIFSDT